MSALGVFLLVAGPVGACALGVYLFLSDLVGLHENESFSAFREEGFKSHLRIHVANDALHLRAVGIAEVPKSWTRGETHYLPKDVVPAIATEVDAFIVHRDE